MPEDDSLNVDAEYLAKRDQRETEIRDIARRTVVFYSELKAQKVASQDMFSVMYPYVQSELSNFFNRIREEEEDD